MHRPTIILIILLISGTLAAQKGTTSPYSYYGLGTYQFKGTMENRSMGGIGVFSDSIHLNLQNPAGYAALQLINFSLGGSYESSRQKTEAGNHTSAATSIDYLALGIPMGKFGIGFGLLPYSSVGYDFYKVWDDGVTEHKGSGGLNRTFLSVAYQVTPELALGFDSNYSFGKINNTATNQKTILQYGTQTENKSELGGFGFNFGAIYKKMISERLQLVGSVNYTPKTKLNSTTYRKIATVNVGGLGITPIDERELPEIRKKYDFPSHLSFGAGIVSIRHWGVAAEYTRQQPSDFVMHTSELDKISYKNASKFKLGGYFIPKYNAFGSYHQRMVYRAGVRFEETGLKIDGHNINEFGISFGLGFPVSRLLSNVNVGFEVGKRGTKDFGLIQENFFHTFLSFSLNDRWFEKRLYD